jgi:uncharacterized membrane protein YphA (DoxX/SURF4 family)
LLFSIALMPTAFAHVGYVAPEGSREAAGGFDSAFLLSALTPFHLLLMLLAVIAVVLAFRFLPRFVPWRHELVHIHERVLEYKELVPWIARLGAGIALIGAGSAGVLISPVLHTSSIIASFEILVGFALLIGFCTGIAAWAVVFLVLIAIAIDPYLIGNLDLLALAFSIIVLADTRPGLDDLLGLPFFGAIAVLKSRVALFLLFEKLLNPRWSEIVVTMYGLGAVIPVGAPMWVLSAGLIELAVGLALLLGWHTRTAAAIAFIVLSASFFYFSESVYSHVTLFATLSIIFILGAGSHGIDTRRHTHMRR